MGCASEGEASQRSNNQALVGGSLGDCRGQRDSLQVRFGGWRRRAAQRLLEVVRAEVGSRLQWLRCNLIWEIGRRLQFRGELAWEAVEEVGSRFQLRDEAA